MKFQFCVYVKPILTNPSRLASSLIAIAAWF
jgi:hypothetical protein